MLIPAKLRKSRNKAEKQPKQPKSWIVLDGEVVLRTVTVDGDRAFVHPERRYSPKGGAKKLARIIDPAHIFRAKSAAIRSLKPRPVWWLSYGKICSGRAALIRSLSDGGTVTAVYDLKGEVVYHVRELYHSRRSVTLALMADNKKRMLRAERDYNEARRKYVRSQRLAEKEIERKGGR